MLKVLALPTLALAAALLLIAAAPPPAWKLSSDGFGPVTIGMTEAQVARALGSKLDIDARPTPDLGADAMASWRSCHIGEAHDSRGLYFMFEDGKLTSIAIGEGSRLKTADGFGLGDTEASVRARYGRALKIENHEYEGPPAHYLTIKGPRPGRGIKFSTDTHGKITSIDAGGPSISYSEGCA